MEPTGAVAVVVDVVGAVELAVCTSVAVLLAARWQRYRAPGTAAALGVFVVLALVLASGHVVPEDPGSGPGLLWSKAVVVLLLALPYLVLVLARVLRAVGAGSFRALSAVYAAEVVLTAGIPPLPEPGSGEQPGWVVAYTLAVVLAWAAQTLVAAQGLWRAGRHESSVVRHRMRSLSAGAVALALAIVVSAAAGADQPPAVELVVVGVGLLSVTLFALAFLLPPSLRLVWRQSDLASLAEAERGVMAALRGRDVAAALEPVLGGVLGGVVVVLDADRRPLREERLEEPEVAALVAQLPTGGDERRASVHEVAPDTLAVRLDRGWLLARAGRLAPVFGDDEAVLLDRVATVVDLALQRVAAFEQEAASRRAAEAATAELETLLHSVSHDLRSPLISVLGYLDVLRSEHAHELTGDGPHHLERLSVNAVYMQALLSDLLDLSRIGRTDPSPVVVDLQALAEQVADATRLRAPGAAVRVQGVLPRLVASDVRLRQLLTNLVDTPSRTAAATTSPSPCRSSPPSTAESSSRCATTAAASRRSTVSACSGCSSGSTRRRGARAPGWAWPSASGSPRAWAAAWSSTGRRPVCRPARPCARCCRLRCGRTRAQPRPPGRRTRPACRPARSSCSSQGRWSGRTGSGSLRIGGV